MRADTRKRGGGGGGEAFAVATLFSFMSSMSATTSKTPATLANATVPRSWMTRIFSPCELSQSDAASDRSTVLRMVSPVPVIFTQPMR